MIPGHYGRETVLTHKKPNNNITTPAKALTDTIARVDIKVEETNLDVCIQEMVDDNNMSIEITSEETGEELKKVSDDCSVDAGIITGVFNESLGDVEVETLTSIDEGNYIQDKKIEDLEVKRKFKRRGQ